MLSFLLLQICYKVCYMYHIFITLFIAERLLTRSALYRCQDVIPDDHIPFVTSCIIIHVYEKVGIYVIVEDSLMTSHLTILRGASNN